MMKPHKFCMLFALIFTGLMASGCGPGTETDQPLAAKPDTPPVGEQAVVLSDEQVTDIVRRSYQYVAMYNVNNKFAEKQGGWGTCVADTQLKDHTLREIARPNNDTLYIACLLDLRSEAFVVNIPAFDSDYASLLISGYDHYVNMPLVSRLGHYQEPETMLIFSARTANYDGAPIDGIGHYFEATGDFIMATIRVMPHFADQERFNRIVDQAQTVKAVTLAEFQGGQPTPPLPVNFPPVGDTDFDTFENNLLEVMQFVFNHTTFDPENEDDQAVLAAYKPQGIQPGQDPASVVPDAIDGKRFRKAAEVQLNYWISAVLDPEIENRIQPYIFQPKGQTNLEATLAVSIIGPVGIPREEAVYPQISTTDGQPMNAMNDYVIRFPADDLPPAHAFWSLTLYDRDEGFFIPNDHKKYSVGANSGMQMDSDGGVEIFIAAVKPEGTPEENWLPIERQDLELSAQMRLYVPDLEALKSWVPPKAEKL